MGTIANSLFDALLEESNFTTTENGAVALKSTTNDLVDLFATVGALRTRTPEEIEVKFSKAFAEDKLLATKMAFYARDIREGGLGERRTPRVIWKFLANNYPEIIRKNLAQIPVFGRWDDLYEFVGTPVEKDMWAFMKKSFVSDLKNAKMQEPISLLAKWMKSENASSKETRKLGALTAQNLGLTSRQYRKTLSKLRSIIDVVEVKMTDNKWSDIVYPAVPSKAMNIYRNAFKRQDGERFEEYIESVSKGETKINASTLFPYDIVEKYTGYRVNSIDKVLEEQWKALPNYVDENSNVLIMADVSGSMSGRPMATSVGLAVYFAERNKGAFGGSFMTFSGSPEFVKIKGNSLYEKVRNAKQASWGMNTNLESAFSLVLNTAVNNNIPKEDMPKSIVVISDMEIDCCSSSHRKEDFYSTMRTRFENAGYQIPNLVFWNVQSRKDTYHAQSNYQGVQLCSGQSASVFKTLVSCIDKTPYEAMLQTLNSDAYSKIVI